MSDSNYKVVWSETSKNDLKTIHDWIKNKSKQGAKNVVSDIRKAPKKIKFPEQTQVEPYFPECRRIVVRHYKILFQVDEQKNTLNILRVFDTDRNPERMETGDF